MRATTLFIAGAFMLGAAAAASAQDATTPPQPPLPDPGALGGDTITVGAGAAYLPDYEGSDDYRVTAVPGAIGTYKGFSFTLAGNRLSVDLIPDKPGRGVNFQLGPVGVLNFNRSSTNSIDDRRVRALGERDTAIELGGYAGIGKTGVITSDFDTLSVSLSYRYDVSGTHSSGILQPSINYLTPLSRKTAVSLFASAEHVEDEYARTYFTVDAAQSARSGLPVSFPRGGWKNFTLGALGTISITGDLLRGLKFVAGGTYSRLLNDFARSPLVRIAGDRNQFLGAAGIAYTF